MCVFNKEVPEIPWFSISRLANGICEKSLLKIIVENLKIYYDVLKKINSKYFFKIKTCFTNINLKFAIPCLTKTILLHKNDLWILSRDVRIKLKLL